MKFNVFLVSKHSSDTFTMTVNATDEDDAMEVANTIIDTDDAYSEYRVGWRISEALEV